MIFNGKLLGAMLEALNFREAGFNNDDPMMTAAEANAIEEAARMMRSLPRGSVLLALTPFEAESIMKSIDNSLDDPDFRKDHFATKARLEAADRLAIALSGVAGLRSKKR